MPEWKSEILRRLAPLKLSPTREAEIAEEVAQHLEDRYQELLASGRTDDEARRTAIENSKAKIFSRAASRASKEISTANPLRRARIAATFSPACFRISASASACCENLRASPPEPSSLSPSASAKEDWAQIPDREGFTRISEAAPLERFPQPHANRMPCPRSRSTRT